MKFFAVINKWSLCVSILAVTATAASAALVVDISGTPGSSVLTMTLSGSTTFSLTNAVSQKDSNGAVNLPSGEALGFQWNQTGTDYWTGGFFTNAYAAGFPGNGGDINYVWSTLGSASNTMLMEISGGGLAIPVTINLGSVMWNVDTSSGHNYLLPAVVPDAPDYPALAAGQPTTITFSGSAIFDTQNFATGQIAGSAAAEAFTFDALQPTNGTPLDYNYVLPEGLEMQANITAIPEPTMGALAGLTVALMGLMRCRRRTV